MENLLLVLTLTFCISIGLGIGLSLGFCFIKSKKNRQKKQSSDQSFTPLHKNNNEAYNSVVTVEPEVSPVKIAEDNDLMTVETKAKLIQNLDKFEKSESYILKNISLPYLAAYLGTNTKYLSNIIKNYKHKDFNSYINDLRIDYIIRKLNENREYRHYKISTLAKEAGYSSHSKFTTIFKSIVGMSPSLYIQNLEKKVTPIAV